MRARPKPLLGAMLGLLLALVAVALSTVLGIAPADRVIVWGAGAVGVLLGGLMLTQRPSLARRRVLVVTVIGGVAAGVALTGVPELTSGGSVSEGCTLTATSSLEPEPMTPADTSAFQPFDVAAADSIEWTATSSTVLTDWTSALGIRIGGFDITLWTGDYANESEVTELSGTERTKPRTDAFAERYQFPLTGVYHVVGSLEADQGDCDADLYMRITPESLIEGWLLLALWSVGAALLLALLVMAWDVRGSIKDADSYEQASHGPGRGPGHARLQDDEAPGADGGGLH